MASDHGVVRRRVIGAFGRPMTLRRPLPGAIPPTYQAVTVQGFQRAYRPEQLTGGLHQGDALVAICANEIAAAAWPSPPRPQDQMLIDGQTWLVQGSQSLYDGAECVGYDLWIRGGQ